VIVLMQEVGLPCDSSSYIFCFSLLFDYLSLLSFASFLGGEILPLCLLLQRLNLDVDKSHCCMLCQRLTLDIDKSHSLSISVFSACINTKSS